MTKSIVSANDSIMSLYQTLTAIRDQVGKMTDEELDQNPPLVIPWSEFHYHLFSHLVDPECPRPLAQEVELYLFPNGPMPDKARMDQAVQATIESQDAVDLNERLTKLIGVWIEETNAKREAPLAMGVR